MRRINLAHGFTLIELLVVIAIIAIITSIGIANLITAQKQARDSARKEIIGNIQSAFEQFYAETGAYPLSGAEGSAFENGVAPADPKNNSEYTLSWNLATDEYCVCAKLENGTGNAQIPTGTTCTWSASDVYYCAQNKQ